MRDLSRLFRLPHSDRKRTQASPSTRDRAHALAQPLAAPARTGEAKLSNALICDILLHPDAQLTLPTLRGSVAGNASLQQDLFTDKVLAPFATAEELRFAAERKTWFLRQHPNATVPTPHFLPRLVLHRWDNKSNRQQQILQQLEAVLHGTESAHAGRGETEFAERNRDKKIRKLIKQGEVDFDFALMLFRSGAKSSRSFDALPLSANMYDEPSLMAAMVQSAPERVGSVGWDLINERNLYRTPQWFASSVEGRAQHPDDDGAFRFAGVFEKLVEQAARIDQQKAHHSISHKLSTIRTRQLQVEAYAQAKRVPLQQAARELDTKRPAKARMLCAVRAVTIDLPALCRTLGIHANAAFSDLTVDPYASDASSDIGGLFSL